MIELGPRPGPAAAPCLPLGAVVAGLAVTGLLVASCASASSGSPARAPASPPPAGATAAAPASATADCHSVTTCYTPRQIQAAYGIRPLLDRGIDGRGETVVLPELAQAGLFPPQVSVISISAAGQTGGELCVTRAEVASLNSALQADADHHVTVVAAAGDTGAAGEPCSAAEALTGGSFPLVKEVNLPSSDPLVLAAGGTSLAGGRMPGALDRALVRGGTRAGILSR
jgi:subtilase family serine protease